MSEIKLLFVLLHVVIQLMWYILKQLLFTSVSVKVVDIYLTTSRLSRYLPLFTSTSVNNCYATVSSLEIGLLQQKIAWYKICHAHGQAHYYFHTGTLKQRPVQLDWLRSLCFSMVDFVPCDRLLQKAYLRFSLFPFSQKPG